MEDPKNKTPRNKVVRDRIAWQGAPERLEKERSGKVVQRTLSEGKLEEQGIASIRSARMKRTGVNLQRNVERGRSAYIALLDNGVEVLLDAEDIRQPLNAIPEIREHIANHRSSKVVVMQMDVDGRTVKRDARLFTASHYDTPIVDVFARKQAFPESAEISMVERIKAMDGGEKAALSGLAIMSGLFLYGAVDNFVHSRVKDAEDRPHVQWSQVTWGAINSALAALTLYQGHSMLRGGLLR